MVTPFIGVYSHTYKPYGTSGTTPPNQAPSVTINGTATGTVGTQQSFQAIASDSDGQVKKVELCLMANATTLTSYLVLDTDLVSPFVLNWTPTVAGNFNLRMRATDDKGATSFSSVLAVQAAAATPGQLTVALIPADYAHNATSENNGAYFRTSSFAEVTAQVGGSYLDLDSFSNWQDPARLQVFVNGVWQQQVVMAPQEAATKRLLLSGSGTKTVLIRLSPQHRDNDFGAVWCTWVSRLSSDGGITVVPPIKPTDERIVLTGDSISGNGTTTNDRLPYPMLFRERRSRDIAVEQWGSRSFGRSFNTEPLRQAHAQKVFDYLNGAAKRINYVALGTNDQAQGIAPADAAAYAGDYFDRVHALDPGIVNYLQIPLLKFVYPNKTTVDTSIEPYWAAFDELKKTRPWLTIVYAQSWLDNTSQYTDWVHPNDPGHDTIEGNFLSVINGQPQAINGLPTVALTINPDTAAPGQARQFTVAAYNLPGVNRADLYDDVTKQIVASSTKAPYIISFTPSVTRGYFAGVNKPGGILYSNVAQAIVGGGTGTFAPQAVFTPTSGAAGTQFSVTSILTNNPGTLTNGVLYLDIKKGDPSQEMGNSNVLPYNITFTPTISGPYYMYYPTPGYNYFTEPEYLEVGDLPAPFTISPRRALSGTLRTVNITNMPAGTARVKLWRDDIAGVQATTITEVAAGDPITWTPELSARFFLQFLDGSGQVIDATNPIQALVDFAP